MSSPVAEVTRRSSAALIAALAASACTLANPLDELQEPSTAGTGAAATSSSSSMSGGGTTGGAGGGVAGGGGGPAGGAPPYEVVADELEGPDAIVADAEFVYVTVPSVGMVIKTAKAGGRIVDPLANGDFVIRSLTLDGSTLFWPVYTEPGGALRRVNTDGSVLYELLGAQQLPTDIAVRGDLV